MAILAVLILFANVAFWTALAVSVKLPPGQSAVTFTDPRQEAEFLRAHPAAAWNHVNGSSPSAYDGAPRNNTNNAGAHGYSEILYSYASQTGSNGSAFAGLTGNTPTNLHRRLAMLIGGSS
jgi:K+-transporting ATPase ATPase A chain